jgi:hypothetical protein
MERMGKTVACEEIWRAEFQSFSQASDNRTVNALIY